MSSPSLESWTALKRIVRYLKGTKNVCLTFNDASDEILRGYCDSDWWSCPDTRRSHSAYCFMLGGGLVSYSRKKQICVADSTAETELIALATCVKQAIYLRSILRFIGLSVEKPTVIHVDNRAAIIVGNNGARTSKTKHIHLKYFLSLDAISRGEVVLKWIPTNENPSDMLTKDFSLGDFTTMYAGVRNH